MSTIKNPTDIRNDAENLIHDLLQHSEKVSPISAVLIILGMILNICDWLLEHDHESK